MASKRVLLTDKDGNQVMPITDGKNVYVAPNKTIYDAMQDGEIIVTSVPVDDEMSDESENAIQNKTAKEYVDNKMAIVGEGAPTESTKAEIGQLYIDYETKKLYVCKDTLTAYPDPEPSAYEWEELQTSNWNLVREKILTEDMPNTVSVYNVILKEDIENYNEFMLVYEIAFSEAHNNLALDFYARSSTNGGLGASMTTPTTSTFSANTKRYGVLHFYKIVTETGVILKYYSQQTGYNTSTTTIGTVSGGYTILSNANLNYLSQISCDIKSPGSTVFNWLKDTTFKLYAR